MRLALTFAALALLSACKKNVTTPAGTEVLRWDKSMATRASVPGARELGARESKDLEIVARPDLMGPATLKLHLETAPLEILESGQTFRHTSPLVVRVSVDANEDWTVSGECQDGPHYQFGPVDEKGSMKSPEAMVLHCDVSMKYLSTMKNLTYVANLEIKGDGGVTGKMGFGTVNVK